MKFAILAASAAMMMFGQDRPLFESVKLPVADKPAPAAPEAKITAAHTERPLTKDEVLEFRSTMAEIKNLRTVYKISEFEDKVRPKVAEQQDAFTKACLSVGVPADKINPTSGPSQCGLNTGLDEEGNPLKGADGKPIPAKVWYQAPPPAK